MSDVVTPVRSVGSEDSAAPRRRRWLIVIAAAVVVAALGTWLVAFSPVFGVRTVEVRGNHVLGADQVRAAARVSNGTPLVRLDTAAVTRRVETLDDVASAQVSTSFPSTVVITIEERVPVGYLSRSGRILLVDRTGDAYRMAPAAPAGLPKLVVATGAQERSAAAAVAAVAAALPHVVRVQVRSIQALDADSITLVLTRDRVVRWGSSDRTAAKARVLPVLLRPRVHQVDLTNPDQPFTR
jgi:cell division protein FtsQ